MENLFNLFFKPYKTINVREDDLLLHIKVNANNLLIPSIGDLEGQLKIISPRDKLNFSINISEETISLFKNDQKSIKDFLQELGTHQHYYENGDDLTSEITIHKVKSQNTISLYSLEIFSNTLINATISESLTIINRAIENTHQCKFETIDSAVEIFTDHLFFSKREVTFKNPDITYLKTIETLKSSTFFSHLENYRLTPEIFKTNSNKHGLPIEKLFKKLCGLFSAIYLFDITSLTRDILEYKINGYKSFSGQINIKDASESTLYEYYEIYRWVYSGGNISDKLGLARNIITLHFKEKNSISLRGSPLTSIRSSYKIYEKQNITQYIEIRNKVSDQLREYNDRASRISDSFAAGYQRSAIALVTFYTSTIVIKVLSSSNDSKRIFTWDTSALSTVFLAISFIYFLIARWEIKEQRSRFKKSYQHLKKRNSDILDESDIKRILNDDVEFEDNIAFINSKFFRYTWIWLSTIGLLLLTTWGLFLANR